MNYVIKPRAFTLALSLLFATTLKGDVSEVMNKLGLLQTKLGTLQGNLGLLKDGLTELTTEITRLTTPSNIDFSKYTMMLNKGVPIEAVRNKMENAGVAERDIEKICGPKPVSTAAPYKPVKPNPSPEKPPTALTLIDQIKAREKNKPEIINLFPFYPNDTTDIKESIENYLKRVIFHLSTENKTMEFIKQILNAEIITLNNSMRDSSDKIIEYLLNTSGSTKLPSDITKFLVTAISTCFQKNTNLQNLTLSLFMKDEDDRINVAKIKAAEEAVQNRIEKEAYALEFESTKQPFKNFAYNSIEELIQAADGKDPIQLFVKWYKDQRILMKKSLIPLFGKIKIKENEKDKLKAIQSEVETSFNNIQEDEASINDLIETLAPKKAADVTLSLANKTIAKIRKIINDTSVLTEITPTKGTLTTSISTTNINQFIKEFLTPILEKLEASKKIPTLTAEIELLKKSLDEQITQAETDTHYNLCYVMTHFDSFMQNDLITKKQLESAINAIKDLAEKKSITAEIQNDCSVLKLMPFIEIKKDGTVGGFNTGMVDKFREQQVQPKIDSVEELRIRLKNNETLDAQEIEKIKKHLKELHVNGAVLTQTELGLISETPITTPGDQSTPDPITLTTVPYESIEKLKEKANTQKKELFEVLADWYKEQLKTTDADSIKKALTSFFTKENKAKEDEIKNAISAIEKTAQNKPTTENEDDSLINLELKEWE